MAEETSFYDSVYQNFAADVLARIRREAFGEDIGQNSWLTASEYREFLSWLDLSPATTVLELCCGSGGPAILIARETGAEVVGIDANSSAIGEARARAQSEGVQGVRFEIGDANAPLNFGDASFEAIVCIDAINHLDDRGAVFREFCRILKPGGRVLFTDPITITGTINRDEIAVRSQIGPMNFTARGENEIRLREAGFEVIRVDDATDNAALLAGRRHAARKKHASDLIRIEGEATFTSTQTFLAMAHRLSSERRLSRFAFLGRKLSGA